MSNENQNEADNHAQHWRRTRRLMFQTLGVWAVFSYLVHWFGDALNKATFLGFPLGFLHGRTGLAHRLCGAAVLVRPRARQN